MIETLTQKLNEENSKYSNEEVEFLINNIGNPNSKIRDDLVCSLFGKSFFKNEFSRLQVEYLLEQVLSRNLLFYKMNEDVPATLTRSFTCLVLGLIVESTNNLNSKYYNLVSKNKEIKIYQDLINYLQTENDFTGFSPQYGWVHAIAHVSDALEICAKQSNFDSEYIQFFLQATKKMLIQVDRRFVDEEEHRLANVFVEAFAQKKLDIKIMNQWIKQFNFDLDDLRDFHRFSNLKSLLEDLSLKLESRQLLNQTDRYHLLAEFLNQY